ncbi:thioesterase family protein [Rufibacter quisquiliarum]|uniref:Putative thioesterase n=1 Tax=Rufibacter quisquiliarum TaxID=1549639 RepID=A0A839GGQ3_9BACT|nr:hotdog domain-containing protein [Rufibacter quisquiliarum]MBA9078072.1 putative thioesterase [Rufibacter quisquiliarum]
MQNPFQLGDTRQYQKTVTAQDLARFESGLVHPVCSTFALAQAMEWAARLFVLEMKDPDEEGIGTMLHIDHHGPAFEGETLRLEAVFQELTGNTLTCAVTVRVGERLVATGQTGQKILKKEKIERLLKNRNA